MNEEKTEKGVGGGGEGVRARGREKPEENILQNYCRKFCSSALRPRVIRTKLFYYAIE